MMMKTFPLPPAGKMALVVLIIREVSEAVPEKTLPVILNDLRAILIDEQQSPLICDVNG